MYLFTWYGVRKVDYFLSNNKYWLYNWIIDLTTQISKTETNDKCQIKFRFSSVVQNTIIQLTNKQNTTHDKQQQSKTPNTIKHYKKTNKTTLHTHSTLFSRSQLFISCCFIVTTLSAPLCTQVVLSCSGTIFCSFLFCIVVLIVFLYNFHLFVLYQ